MLHLFVIVKEFLSMDLGIVCENEQDLPVKKWYLSPIDCKFAYN